MTGASMTRKAVASPLKVVAAGCDRLAYPIDAYPIDGTPGVNEGLPPGRAPRQVA